MSSAVHQHSQETLQREVSEPVSPAERLVHWFQTNGGELSHDVEVAFSHSRGYYCRALRPLRSPVLAKCPLSLTLSYLNLDHAQSVVPHVASPLAKCLGLLPNNVLTYLLLIEQRLHPDQQCLKWHPYVACLPDPAAMTTPLWFDDGDLQCLAGTNLAKETSVKLDQLTREWTQAKEVLQRLDIDADYYNL